jgi:phospholipid/cholesterol/gamma-HCH transport system substrate-binding protein
MYKTLRLGIFIVTALVLFAAGVFWIGSKQFLFTSTYHLNAEFQNVAGLVDGAEVRVGGLHQGTVKRIDLPRGPGQKLRVVMDLKGITRDVIKKDSVAAISSEGLVGDKFIEISFGSAQAQKVNEGDTIQTATPLQISDLIQKANSILDSASGTIQNVGDTAANLEAISDKINRGAGTVGALVNDKSVFQNANAAVKSLQEDMEALKHNFLLRGFFKNRGYEDSTELKKYAIQQLPSKPPAKTFAFDASKIFDKSDTAKLKKGKVVDEGGAYLEGNPFSLAVVAAYTDKKGDTEKDKVLSEARAMVVRDYLVHNFKLDDTRIKTAGLGKSPDVSEGGKVEIIVYR